MYQVNKTTGDIKQVGRLTKGYIEVGQEEYEKLQRLSLEDRQSIFVDEVDNDAPDSEYDNVQVNKKLTVGKGNNVFNSDGKENSATGAYIGMNPLTAEQTFKLDALLGDASFTGKVATKDFDASGTATARSQKGNKSVIATLEDVASAQVKIKSPNDTIAISTDGDTTTIDARIATALKAGIALFPIGSGLTINAKGEVGLDGAHAPFKFIDIWDASTNTPKLSDATGQPETFYITHVPGTQNLGSGAITFGIGDWVMCQEDVETNKPKYVKVPMSEVLGAITASMIKAGTLGKGIAMDTDQPIKTTAGMESGSLVTKTITVVDIIVTGSIVGQK